MALPGYQPSLADAAFYAFGLTGVLFTSITILVMREPRYLLYSGFTFYILCND